MQYSKENILADIERVPSDIHKKIMCAVVDYAFKYQNVKEIGIGDVKQIVKDDFSEVDILLSLQMLCLLQYPLLELKYEFQKDEDDYYLLTKNDIKEAKKNGFLINPVTGNAIPKGIFESKVFMFFEIKRF